MTRHTWLIVAYAVGACLLAWAVRNPRCPSGISPDLWARTLRQRARKLRRMRKA